MLSCISRSEKGSIVAIVQQWETSPILHACEGTTRSRNRRLGHYCVVIFGIKCPNKCKKGETHDQRSVIVSSGSSMHDVQLKSIVKLQRSCTFMAKPTCSHPDGSRHAALWHSIHFAPPTQPLKWKQIAQQANSMSITLDAKWVLHRLI